MARRLIITSLTTFLACLLCLAPAPSHADNGGDRGRDSDHETIVHRHGAACGVERWNVKTGMDPDARAVDLRHVVATNIVQLRALTPPATLPANRRIRPVETTVYALDAFLIRYKQEADSDYHLVLADSGGRTMIAEIPAPPCLSTSSPFHTAIAAVRAAFTPRFQPDPDRWQRLKLPVRVTGVGFFDFKHGQSGVAPNAIELHPILSLTWPGGGAARSVPTVVATPPAETPVPVSTASTQAGPLTVSVSVSPTPTSDGTPTTVTARTAVGARCTVKVRYASGSLSGSRYLATTPTADSRGQVSWTWTLATHRPGLATARVQCTLNGHAATATASFTVQ